MQPLQPVQLRRPRKELDRADPAVGAPLPPDNPARPGRRYSNKANGWTLQQSNQRHKTRTQGQNGFSRSQPPARSAEPAGGIQQERSGGGRRPSNSSNGERRDYPQHHRKNR